MRVVDVQPVHDDCWRGVPTILVRRVEGVAGAEEACGCGRGTEEREQRVARGKPAGAYVGTGRRAGSLVLAGRCGLWGRGGREAALRMLSVALVMWEELGRGRGHTPPVTLPKIGGGHCGELVIRQKHSCHVVAEAHLPTVVRAMGREWRSADGCRDAQECRGKGKFSGSRVWTCISV